MKISGSLLDLKRASNIFLHKKGFIVFKDGMRRSVGRETGHI